MKRKMYANLVRASLLLPFLIYVSADVRSDHQNTTPVTLSKTHLWPEAVKDGTCVIVGNNSSGAVKTKVTETTFLDSLTRGGTEPYYTQVWLDFKGCVYGKVRNYSDGITVSGDPAKSCLLYCNFGGFFLTEQKCYCLKNVQLVENNACKAKPCISYLNHHCGSGSYVFDYIIYNCMCEYGIMNDSSMSLKGQRGTCMTATYEGDWTTFQASNCSSNHSGFCYNMSHPGIVSKSSPGCWSDSFLRCYDENKQFAGKLTLLNSTLPDISNGVYWVGAFAVSYQLWANQSTFDNMECIEEENNLTTNVITCNTSITTFCGGNCSFIAQQLPYIVTRLTRNPSAINYNTDSTNTDLACKTTNNDKTTMASPYTSGASTGVSIVTDSYETLDRRLTKLPLTAIVGSSIGALLCLVILAVIYVVCRRRGVFTKRHTNNPEDAVCDSFEMTNSQQVTTDIYNHLNEIKKEEGEDLYDHSFIGNRNEPYGTLGRDDDKHDNDTEYDHTSTMDDTYGHTRHLSSRYVDNNEYDHVGAFPDNTGNGTYGHLHEKINYRESDSTNCDSTGEICTDNFT